MENKKLQKIYSWKEKKQGQTALEIDFERNRSVSKIVLGIGGALPQNTNIKVRYAQNNITSDLILFTGTYKIGTGIIEIESGVPALASQLYIEIETTVHAYIQWADVYECICKKATSVQEKAEVISDEGNIAFRKPVHTSSGKETAVCLTDGSYHTFWQGDMYPAYMDIDLEHNYYLEKLELYAPSEQGLVYSIYTSLNDRDFELASKSEKAECKLYGKEARVIRIHIEYASVTSPVIHLVRVLGTPSESDIIECPSAKVPVFADTQYEHSITKQDVYDEVLGIVERRIGKDYGNWFKLELAEPEDKKQKYDYYELSDNNGKIHVKGNTGVSLAAGIHHYLKHYCKVHVSQVGDQVQMPQNIVPIYTVIHRETKAKIRYAYNYCTLSYTMAFWGEKEWRDELDWLALNGVNLVLDITGQEEVWRRFLSSIGYAHKDIKDFLAGPAYYAWAYMANLSGFGGPIHDSWFAERAELARHNHFIMRKLGMQPVLQGYSGMLPNDIGRYDKNVKIIEQGTWGGFQRPAMIQTTSESFQYYAQKFYQAQREVYGEFSHYYATDPFHEGGNTGGMSAREISSNVLSSMLEMDSQAVWVIQSWQGNPTSELLTGLEDVEDGKSHALILDLYAEKTPHYGEGMEGSKAYGYCREFNDTPWVYCMLNNFGGRLGMHGHLDNLSVGIPVAFRQSQRIAGIGITPESSENNPVLYDFLFESIWQDHAEDPLEAISLKDWIAGYIERRYGAVSTAAVKAWELLLDTVYKAEWNHLGQGAPECVANARPAWQIQAASAWGNAIVSYDMKKLKQAEELLLQDYKVLKESQGYIYDVVSVQQQVLSNEAFVVHIQMRQAFEEKNVDAFERYARQFLELMEQMETVTGKNKYYTLDRWLKQAEELGKHTDDFSKRLYLWNARMLITTWGAYEQSEKGRLHDYSNRQWSGLIQDFYKPRWELWLDECRKELTGEPVEEAIDWFAWEWNWIRQ